MSKILYVLIFITLFSACEKDINFDLKDSSPLLVVDAKIENNRKKILIYQSEHKDFVDNLYLMGNCPALLWEHYFSLF